MAVSVVQSLLSGMRAVFGTANDRLLKRVRPKVEAINALEPRFQAMSGAELKAQAARFRERLAAGEALDGILPEAFALVREAGRRYLRMRHFDVQLIGGMVLHMGRISEMKTGEGKTLVATLAAYLNALPGKGVHIVTVNDYLARRDTAWMGPLYEGLGLTVACIQHEMDDAARREAYAADITYGTNNEFGFDYLRDNMKFEADSLVQRGLHYAIVDEVDSILIDEARTPLIISGPAEEATRLYSVIDRLIQPLLREQRGEPEPAPEEPEEEDGREAYVEGKDAISKKKYEFLIVDEKSRTVGLKERGVAEAERLLGRAGVLEHNQSLYDMQSITVLHHVEQALRAHALFTRDIDYVVKEDQVVIVDEFTGRLMPGRRYSDGLHQALEAKEGGKIQEENVTLATITFQNYFRLYGKLAGMTGTADTEASEFNQIYKLDVAVIPTNCPLIRTEYADLVYRTEREKLMAVVEEIADWYKQGRPVLVGTVSIEKSEKLAALLKRYGVPHHVLNAKNHEREAEIIAQAGRKKAITISTNMAGRGTDILLGGNPEFLAAAEAGEGPGHEAAIEKFRAQCAAEHDEVVALGGLHVLGTERHESRRIDNQLRGRAGRQGDPGSSRFYLSLEDDLLRIFGSDRIKGIMEKLGMEEGVPIEARMVTRAIENAQKRVEAHHFEMRKHLLEYDDVLNKQREVIYTLRRVILAGEDIGERTREVAAELLDSLIDLHLPEGVHFEEWDLPSFAAAFERQYGVPARAEGYKLVFEKPACAIDMEEEEREAAAGRLQALIQEAFQAKYGHFDEKVVHDLERLVYIQVLDAQWKDHLTGIEHLKEGIGLRGYAQVNPLNEYKKEAFALFEALNDRIDSEAIQYLYRLEVSGERVQIEEPEPDKELIYTHASSSGFGGDGVNGAAEAAAPIRRKTPKVGRNDPCPCGSGKKYKHCHGR